MPENVTAPTLWPFPVRYPVEEVLEWRTDVLASFEVEQRIALRPVPRALLTYRHLLDAAGMARASALARAGFACTWLLPIWSMTARPDLNIHSTDTVISMPDGTDGYQAPGFAVVAQHGEDAHMVEIAAVFPDRLELTAPVGISLANILIAPAYAASMNAPVQIERKRQSLGVVTASFTITENMSGLSPAASSFPDYLETSVVTDPTVLRQPLRDTLGQTVAYIDNGTGPIIAEPLRSFIERKSILTFVDYGIAARRSRRRWLYAVRGRQQSFWLPTWGRELVLQGQVSASATSITVAPITDLANYVARHIMFDLPNGAVFREVTSASIDPDNPEFHRLDIEAPGVSIPASTQVHFLNKMRFDTDRFELSHTPTNTEMSAAVVEISEDTLT